MPYTIKNTLIFEDSSYGWTESFFSTAVSGDLINAGDRLDLIAQKRAKLLGSDGRLKGWRVSIEFDNGTPPRPVLGDSRAVEVNYAGSQPPAGTTDPQTIDAYACAKPGVGILLKWRSTDGTLRKLQFMRGIPDGLEILSGKPYLTQGTWLSDFVAWRTAMLGGGSFPNGWMANLRRDTVAVTDYVVDAGSNQIVMTITPNLFPPPFNVRQRVRVSGVNGKSTLNGSQLIDVLSTTQIRTVKPLAVFPFTAAGRVTAFQPAFIQVFGIDTVRIVYRKPGRPLLVSRGRAPVRPRG